MRTRQLIMNINTEYKIGENEPVRLLEKIIDEIYEKEVEFIEDYHFAIPEDILMKILIYGYMNGAYSSREIEKRCHRDIHFMYLQNTYREPDHCMISRFRKKMKEQIEKVFNGIVKYLKENKEISGENLFIDGTKIEANANRYTFVWKKTVQKNEVKLQEKIEKLKAEIESENNLKFKENAELSEIIKTIEQICVSKGIEFVHGRGQRKSKLQKQYEALCEYMKREEKYASYNELFDGRNSFSKTDTDATFMHMKEDHMRNGQLKPGYNMQIAVEGEYILGVDISSERSDMRTLIPFVEKIRKLNIFEIQRIIADSGYESEHNYSYLQSKNIQAYIKPSNYETK